MSYHTARVFRTPNLKRQQKGEISERLSDVPEDIRTHPVRGFEREYLN